jgi:hypothetical protein
MLISLEIRSGGLPELGKLPWTAYWATVNITRDIDVLSCHGIGQHESIRRIWTNFRTEFVKRRRFIASATKAISL